MRVHPAPRKRTIAVQRCAAAAGGALGGKKLRRLPHIFAKVLELPFAADADVSVEEDAAALRFVAAAVDGFSPAGARAHAVEIHPGVTKVVIRDLASGGGAHGEGDDDDEGAAAFELDRWRFRLPPCTRPAMATATYAEGELVVTVPKGAGPDEGDGDGATVLGVQQEMFEREIGRLRSLYQQQQQQQQQQQAPVLVRSNSRDLDAQFANLSLKHKDPNSGRDALSGSLRT